MKSRLGQNFLKDKKILKEIAGILDVHKNDIIIEIGGGHGELTSMLGNDGHVISIEKDNKLYRSLKEKFSKNENINIKIGDAVRLIPEISRKLSKKYKIIGNIPFYSTGRILRTIGELKNKPTICVLTMQKEVAEKIASLPPRASKISSCVQFWADPRIVKYIPKKYFNPVPKVDSAVVLLKTIGKHKKDINGKEYYEAVKILFRQPRKTILNNIKQYINSHLGRPVSADIEKKLELSGINPNNRPQNLSVKDIIKISKTLLF